MTVVEPKTHPWELLSFTAAFKMRRRWQDRNSSVLKGMPGFDPAKQLAVYCPKQLRKTKPKDIRNTYMLKSPGAIFPIKDIPVYGWGHYPKVDINDTRWYKSELTFDLAQHGRVKEIWPPEC